ncbi:MAG: type II secretion system F family protein [Candidatus Micrarchaeota archaeon]
MDGQNSVGTQRSRKSFFTPLAELLLPYFPDLKKKLLLANSKYVPTQFLENAAFATIMLTFVMTFVTLVFIIINNLSLLLILPLFVLYVLLFLFYFMLEPEAMVLKRQREIDYEILFAGRHFVIALKSGMPLFDSIVGLRTGYGEVSREFEKIVEKVMLGVPTTQAIREVVQNNPSKYFVRISVQIANSVASGSDVASSVDSVLDQIAKEQLIQLKEYGQKLTPAVMFFMIFGIILPSIGVVLATVLFSVISGSKLGLTSSILVAIFVLIAIVQFLFLGIIETSRPKYLL